MKTGLLQYLRGWPAQRWLFLLVGAYFVVALGGTWINFVDLHLANLGIYDLSISQQALASTAHGGIPFPFYEATNCGRNARCSFLLVHPALAAYLVAVPYGLFASPYTLFALQDLALGLAALPLFALARKATASGGLALLTAGAYLIWVPAFSGVFSFHWESFVPLELFLTFWLWTNQRYWTALPLILISFVTIEVVPVLLFFLALYFLSPWLRPGLRLLSLSFRSWLREDRGRQFRRELRALAWRVLRSRAVLASLALLVGSAAAYVLLHEFVTRGGWVLGLPPLPAEFAIPLTQPVHAASFTAANLLTAWPSKLLFWLTMLLTLGLIPLLAPRTWILSAPWVLFSLFATGGYYVIGNQYGFISAAVLFIGFAYGLGRLARWAGDPSVRRQPDPGEPEGGRSHLPHRHRPPRAGPRPVGWALLAALLTGVLVVNLLLNPLNPLAQGLKTSPPFLPKGSLALDSGYHPGGYQDLERLVALMGPNAVVASSLDLFTFVANDPYAYPLVAGMNFSNLPFDTPVDTQYVLLTPEGPTVLPSFLTKALYDPASFGVRAWVPGTSLGGILLFERGYPGPVETIGTAPLYSGGAYAAGSGVEPGSAGTVAQNRSSPTGEVIRSRPLPSDPALSTTGRVWVGPATMLTAGAYQVQVALEGSLSSSAVPEPARTHVAVLRLHGFEDLILQAPVELGAFSSGPLTLLTFDMVLPFPVLQFEVIGTLSVPWLSLQLDYLTITPS